MSIENVKSILLDNDGTVMNFSLGQKTAFKQSCDLLHYEYTDELCALYDKINKKYWEMFERDEVKKSDLILQRFVEYFQVTGIDGDPHKMEAAYRDALGEQVALYDGAEEGMKYLSEKYNVYIVTNGVEKTQKSRFNKSGLLKYVKKLYVSEEVGFRKPQKEFFDYVFADAGIDKDSTIIIGDSMSSDILGGINAGIRTVWYNRKLIEPKYTPDYTVYNWQDIVNLL